MMQAFAMDLFCFFDMIYGGNHDSHFEIVLDVMFRICLGLCSCTFRKPLDGQAIVIGNFCCDFVPNPVAMPIISRLVRMPGL